MIAARSSSSLRPSCTRRGAVAALSLLCASLAFIPSAAFADPSLTVFAAASLRESFEAAAPVFTAKTGTKLSFSFAGSDTLEAQIAQGAPADVFASANTAQMKKADDAGLLAGAPRVFARNGLVIIVPKDNPAKVASAADLARTGVHVVLAAPTVPVGGYARTAFANLAKLPDYGPNYESAVTANVVSNEIDVKAVVTKVSLGEADAGVCYRTDVTPAVADKVTAIAFPAGSAPEATYPIAVVKATKDAAQAQAFVDFVLSPDGQRFLNQRGFLAPAPEPAGVH